MMSRKRALLVIPAAAAIALSVGVAPASAAGNESANCVGETVSLYNSMVRGSGGQFIAFFAQEGIIGETASTDCGAR